MNKKYFIKDIESSEFKQWDDFVMKVKYSTPFSTSWFMEALCKVFGGKFKIIGVFNKKNNNLVAGVALRYLERFKYKIVLPSQLLLYMPLIINVDQIHDKEIYDVEQVLGEFIKSEFNTVLYMNNTTDLKDIRAFKDNKFKINVGSTVISDLRNLDFYDVGKSHRKLIKKGDKNELYIKECNDAHEMWEVWTCTSKRQSFKLKLNESQFKYLYDTLKEKNCCQGFMVYTKENIPVSFRIAMWCNKSRAYGWIAGTNPNYFNIGASTFMIWNSLNLLKEKEFESFDWCGANIKEVADFKMSFGAKLTPYFYLDKYSILFKMVINARNIYKKICR